MNNDLDGKTLDNIYFFETGSGGANPQFEVDVYCTYINNAGNFTQTLIKDNAPIQRLGENGTGTENRAIIGYTINTSTCAAIGIQIAAIGTSGWNGLNATAVIN